MKLCLSVLLIVPILSAAACASSPSADTPFGSGSSASSSGGSGGSGGGSGSGASGGPGGSGSGGGTSSGASGGAGADDGGFDATVGDDGGVDAPTGCSPLLSSQTSFVNLAPPGLAQGTALDPNENDPVPGADAGMSAPSGWHYYNFPGAMCRDGSQLGIYVRYGSVNKVMISLDGGGVCIRPHFCDNHPATMNKVFPGGSLNGESFSGSLATASGLQAPYSDGIFDETNSANPFQSWSEIYVPYCTGDAHIGTNPNGNVPNDL